MTSTVDESLNVISGLESQRDTLSQTVEAQKELIGRQAVIVSDANVTESHVATLREALRPFADTAKYCSITRGDRYWSTRREHFEAAAAAMKATEGDSTEQVIETARELSYKVMQSDLEKIALIVDLQEGEDIIEVVRGLNAKANECDALLINREDVTRQRDKLKAELQAQADDLEGCEIGVSNQNRALKISEGRCLDLAKELKAKADGCDKLRATNTANQILIVALRKRTERNVGVIAGLQAELDACKQAEHNRLVAEAAEEGGA